MICHLCDAPLSEAVSVGTTGRHGDVFASVACARCGLVQQTPLPSEAELAAYYAGPYREQFRREPVRGPDGSVHEWGSPEAEALMDGGARQYAAEITRTLGLESIAKLLEVGCGDGRLSAALKSHATSVWACDADQGMRAEARRRGVRANWDSMEDVYQYARAWVDDLAKFDAIVSCHVLEHFREPLAALAQMRSLLRPGGRVWLEVPNLAQPYGDLDTHYWQRPHLYCFTAHTLALLLTRAGFDDVHISDSGHLLFAYATSGEREPVGYEAALARFVETTRAPVPTGAEIAAHLDDYRASRAKRDRRERCVSVLQAFRAGEQVDLEELRDAFDLLGEQSRRAAQIATRAIMETGQIVEALDGVIAAADGYDADDWLQGERAGAARMAASTSHALGRLMNEWKLIELGGAQ